MFWVLLSGALVLADAMSASDVADRVFEAVVEERFYILTHADTTPAVQLRLTNILEGHNPELWGRWSERAAETG